MDFEQLKRTDYPDRPERTHTDQAHFRDFRDYHLPLARMHHAHLHNSGIARGLEVRGAIGGDTVTVEPGVAVDARGQLLVLTQETARLTSNFLNSVLYVTLKFAETLGADGRLAQVPEVRLQTVSAVEGSSDETLVVLGLVETDGNGRVTALKAQDSGRPLRRQLLGEQVEALEIRRSEHVGDRLATVTSGKIASIDTGGLRITVPEQTDEMLLARENGGEFAKLEIRTDSVVTPGDISIGGNVQVIGTIQGTLAPAIVGPDQLAAAAVITAKIADNAVTLGKIAPGVLPPDIGITVTQTIQNGQSIPVPSGFQRSECVFFVALKFLNIDPSLGRQILSCNVDANGKVTTSDPGRIVAMGVAMAKRGGW